MLDAGYFYSRIQPDRTLYNCRGYEKEKKKKKEVEEEKASARISNLTGLVRQYYVAGIFICMYKRQPANPQHCIMNLRHPFAFSGSKWLLTRYVAGGYTVTVVHLDTYRSGCCTVL